MSPRHGVARDQLCVAYLDEGRYTESLLRALFSQPTPPLQRSPVPLDKTHANVSAVKHTRQDDVFQTSVELIARRRYVVAERGDVEHVAGIARNKVFGFTIFAMAKR